MATITGIVSASDKIGNPITVGITAAVLTGVISFHNVKVIVTCHLLSNDGETTLASGTFEMSTPATNGEAIVMDVSSALRAVADQYEYSADVLLLPYAVGSISVYDEYMSNGVVSQTQPVTLELGTYYMGAYSDLERYIAGNFKNALTAGARYTRKPANIPEIWMQGETYVYPSSPNVSVAQQLSVLGRQVINGHAVFVLPAPASISNDEQLTFQPDTNRYVIRFVNGLGCIESIGVTSVPKVGFSMVSEQLFRSGIQTFGNPSRSIYLKRNNRETWTFSTGPLSKEWIDWYAHDFLTASCAWLLLGSRWLPIHIVPDESVTLVDPASGKALDLQFNVQFDFDGSPLEVLAV